MYKPVAYSTQTGYVTSVAIYSSVACVTANTRVMDYQLAQTGQPRLPVYLYMPIGPNRRMASVKRPQTYTHR